VRGADRWVERERVKKGKQEKEKRSKKKRENGYKY